MNYDGTVKFDTRIDTKTFEKSVSSLKKTAVTSFSAIGAAAVAGIGAATKVGMDFEKAMSSVAAISMATGKDLQMLKDAAKEMGETTKFSATQAANALEYLSLAGYNAQDSVKALPYVLNLAAAGGMDLAYTSDLLTDSMAVMGLGIDNMANFSDQLAMAASKSNTSVQQLGEAVLVAGGQAKLANMSVEDMNTALGILADKGIKGSEGGTALRNTLKNLYTPTSKAADMLEKLGVKTSDSKGNLLPLQDVLQKLNASLGELSADKKISAMAEIFDTRTIAAATALLDDCGDRWNELNGYLSDCDGAASQMADTMNDNLEGQLTLCASAAEGLGIQVYESIGGTLKDSVKIAASEISKLTKSIKSGELKPAVENTGKLFSSLSNVVIKLVKVTFPPLIKVLGFVGEHFSTVASVVLAAVAAYKAMAIVKMVNSLIVANNIALQTHTVKVLACAAAGEVYTGTLTAQQIIIGVLTGKIGLVTAAQELWNLAMSANPTGLVITGVVAFVAVLGTLAIALGKQKSETDKLIESMREEKQAYDELKASQNEQAATDIIHTDRTQELADELRSLADENGAVADSYKTRAQFILNELNDALGTEYTMTGNVIDRYKNLEDEIDNLIQKKKAEILLDANKETYTEAIKNYNSAVDAQKEAYKELLKAQEEYEETRKKAAEGDYEASFALGEKQRLLDEAQKAYNETAKTVQQYSNDIQNYEDAQTAALEGNYQQTVDILARKNEAYKTAADVVSKEPEKQKEILGKQFADAILEAEVAAQNLEKNNNAYNQKQLEQAQKHAEKMKEEFEKVGGHVVNGMIEGLSKKEGDLKNKVDALAKSVPEWMKKLLGIHSPSRVMRNEVGKYIPLGVAAGIEENSDSVVEAFKKMFNKLDYQRKFDIINDDEYYTELEKLRDKYFKIGTKEWLDYTEKIYNYQQQLLEDTKKKYKDTYKDIYDYAEDKIDAVIKKQDNYAKKLKSYGNLFQKVTIALDDGNIEYYRMADLKKDTEAITKYNDLMTQVRQQVLDSGLSKSVADSFLGDINDLSIEEGTQALEALMRVAPQELADYLKAYENKFNLAESMSANMYDSELKEATDESYNYLVQKLTEAGFEVPENFFDSGILSAQNFGQAFAKQLGEELAIIKEKINAFTAKIGIGITASGPLSVGAGPISTSYYSSYYLQPAKGESTHAQLRLARDYEEFQKMRRGF